MSIAYSDYKFAGQVIADLGFSYDMFDEFVLNGTTGDPGIDYKIRQRYAMSQHKREF